MAIALVDSNTSSLTTTGGPYTTHSVTAPAGLADGHLVILVICNNGSINPNAMTFDSGSGFTLEKEFTAIGNPKWGLWWKIASGEPATYTLSGFSVANSSLCVVAFSGVDTTTP